MVDLTGHLDHKLKEANNRHRVHSLQDQILNAPILAMGDRIFVREAGLALMGKGERVWRHVILFNDALMVLKYTKKKDVPYEFEWMCALKELTPEELMADVKGTNYENPQPLAKRIQELEEKVGRDKTASPLSLTSSFKEEGRKTMSLRGRVSMFGNESHTELFDLQALYDLNKFASQFQLYYCCCYLAGLSSWPFFFLRGKVGLQVTYGESSKLVTETLIFENEETRKAWVDDIKRFTDLTERAKLSDRQIQQSHKVLIWSSKKKEKKLGFSSSSEKHQAEVFTIQQLSLNRLPSKSDSDAIHVLWAADVILVNVSQPLLLPSVRRPTPPVSLLFFP